MKHVCAWCGIVIKTDSIPSSVEGFDITHGICEKCDKSLRKQPLPSLHAQGYKIEPKMVESNSHVVEEVDEKPSYKLPLYFVVVMLVIYVVAVVLIWNS